MEFIMISTIINLDVFFDFSFKFDVYCSLNELITNYFLKCKIDL